MVKDESVRLLDKVIKYKGFDYERVYEDDRWYVYCQRYGGEVVGYEVMERRVNSMYGCESWPSDKAFGVWAWSFYSLGAAREFIKVS